jgi:hypothetical protein
MLNGTATAALDPGITADTQRLLDGIAGPARSDPSGGNDPGAVPEPSSLALLGGAAALLLLRRR